MNRLFRLFLASLVAVALAVPAIGSANFDQPVLPEVEQTPIELVEQPAPELAPTPVKARVREIDADPVCKSFDGTFVECSDTNNHRRGQPQEVG